MHEIKDLPSKLIGKLLRPRGYELPGCQAQLLGRGSFGRVLKVRRVLDGRLFAIKRQLLGEAADDAVPVLREISILNVLRGACNVVKIEDAFLVRPVTGTAEIWTVLEHFPHNLHKVRHWFRAEEPARPVIFQILMGLHSLHSADIIHRDLKPENILVALGSNPPWTVRVALCDFGTSRSVHGFREEDPEDREDLPPVPAMRRKLTDRVTSCWWRAPEMWGWADTGQMTKRDLKSLDVFAFGLVWAGLLAWRGVLTHEEGVDPPKFRLLEILRKVDLPGDGDLLDLGFSSDVSHFIKHVLASDVEAIRPEILGADWPRNRTAREAMLQAPYTGIREWVLSHNRQQNRTSKGLALVEWAARFSYKKRPTVQELLADRYFDSLRAVMPRRHWAKRNAPRFDDVRAALEVEQTRQRRAAQRAQELRKLQADLDQRGSKCGGVSRAEDAFMHRIASNAAAAVEESVRNVCDRVRAELVQTQRHERGPHAMDELDEGGFE